MVDVLLSADYFHNVYILIAKIRIYIFQSKQQCKNRQIYMPIATVVSIGIQHPDIPSFDFNPLQIIGKSKKINIEALVRVPFIL